MRWRGRQQSTNVEDRRGMGGAMGGRPMAVGGGCLGLVLVVVFVLMGGDPRVFLQQGAPPGAQAPAENQARAGGEDDQLGEFSKVVLRDTEAVWSAIFSNQLGKTYNPPEMVLFSGQVRSACGFASAAVGPFYCPGDQKVYLDLSFFQQMHSELNAPGDFAMAYVIAHEVAHHVQNELGQMQKVHSAQRGVGETQKNQLSVRLELQADYLAGVWAHHAQQMFKILEPGDIEEALRAATAIGDDKLQKSAQGYVVPDSFTHGTSAQRFAWFHRGLETGDIEGMFQLFELRYDSL